MKLYHNFRYITPNIIIINAVPGLPVISANNATIEQKNTLSSMINPKVLHNIYRTI